MNTREQIAYWGGAVLVALFSSAIIANTTMLQPQQEEGDGIVISAIDAYDGKQPPRVFPVTATHVRVEAPRARLAVGEPRIRHTASISRVENAAYSPLIARVQRKLARLGYAPGPVDGRLGPATRAAIRKFQRDNGLPVTGNIEPGVMALLLP